MEVTKKRIRHILPYDLHSATENSRNINAVYRDGIISVRKYQSQKFRARNYSVKEEPRGRP